MTIYKCANCGYESEDKSEFVCDTEINEYEGYTENALLCYDCHEWLRDELDSDFGIGIF